MENKLRKHRKQMSVAEIEYTESLVHSVTNWRTEVCRGHLLKRGRTFTHEQIVNVMRTGWIVEVNSLGRVLMRDSTGLCVVVNVKARVAFTVWQNAPSDNHDNQSMGMYTWKVDVISYLRGL
jgi:hypothetical protein